jgi:hypothetical protein
VDGFEENKVDRYLEWHHEMQCVEWQGKFPSSMVHEQGEEEEEGKTLKTTNRVSMGKGGVKIKIATLTNGFRP